MLILPPSSSPASSATQSWLAAPLMARGKGMESMPGSQSVVVSPPIWTPPPAAAAAVIKGMVVVVGVVELASAGGSAGLVLGANEKDV